MILNTRSLMAWLGYAGLLPFYASALWLLLPAAPGKPFAADVFVAYGVVILAFLGGTLWGNAVVRPAPGKTVRLVLSNAVALFAVAAGLAGSALLAAVLLALGQLALLTYERSTGDRGGWYLILRTRLTLGVMPAHLLFVAAMWN
jgi:hypothetical protein